MNRAFIALAVSAIAAWALYVAWARVGEVHYQRGVTAERAAWLARDNSTLREANKALDAMHRKVEADERAHAKALAEAALTHRKELNDVTTQRDRALADVRAGRLRLRGGACAGTNGATGAGGGELPVQPAAASPTGGDAAAEGSELPEPRAEAVVRLLSDADKTVKELNYCWSVVRKDRGLH